MRVTLLLLVSACARPALLAPEPPPPPIRCDYDVHENPTLGERQRVGFTFFPAVSQRLETPLAAGGAHTHILALSASSVPPVRSLRSTHPEVAVFDLESVGGSACQNQALLVVHSGVPGRSQLILYDEDGGAVDEVGVTVEATLQLMLDRSFDAPVRIIAGSLQGLHTTTLGGDGVLVGTGAVKFRLEGDLFAFPDRDAAPPWWGGDALAFTGKPGRGRVLAEAGGVRVGVLVEVVDASSLASVSFAAQPAVWPAPVEVRVSGEPDVYGAQCRWRWPFRPPEWVDGGWIGGEPTARYRFTAPWRGTFTAECRLPNDERRSINLSFE